MKCMRRYITQSSGRFYAVPGICILYCYTFVLDAHETTLCG